MPDSEEIYRIRKTFATVERQSDVAALVFYQRLFDLDPALRPLFKNDIEEQARKLMDMLAAALNLLERPDQFSNVLEELGAAHVGYGVKTEHYETVAVALLGMLEQVLGPEFTPQTRAAWSSFYDSISENMLRGAAMAAGKR